MEKQRSTKFNFRNRLAGSVSIILYVIANYSDLFYIFQFIQRNECKTMLKIKMGQNFINKSVII